MPKVKLYNSEGTVVGERELDANVFGVEVNAGLVHEVMVGLMANARQSLAHTKTKGEVRGGGKKPWKQKGTGRARQGSSRNPHWIGGGVAFGPRSERDYSKKINRKMKRLAMAMVLSDKVANDRLVLVEAYPLKEGKTKEMVALLKKLPVKGSIMCMNTGTSLLGRSVRNLPKVSFAGTGDVSMNDVLGAEYLISTPESLEKLVQVYGK